MGIFHKILIANRGEIAVRIIKTASRLGIKTVAVFSGEDRDALHVRMADEAYGLAGDHLSETYLNFRNILRIARNSGSAAIHPGYGFLSENPDFAEACKKNRITFIGPSAEAIRLMGNKIAARDFVRKTGVPVLDVITGNRSSLIEQGHQIEYPVLVKAAGGGGGKGMRILYDPAKLETTVQSTAREAKSYFDNDEVYLEKYIENPRHIEVQILGDQQGKVIHLFERECSIQRRYQKIIEETPAVGIPETVRERIRKDAVSIAEGMNYSNAGTIEFLVDEKWNFYFLEMNTRLQVEHPVTEMTTGIDLVEEQIRISSGEMLRWKQEDIKQNGHAMECRIYAEDPENRFLPSPGGITYYREPGLDKVRVDSGMDRAGPIYSNYDPLIGKLVAWGTDRKDTMDRMQNALSAYIIHGLKQNIPFLQSLIQHPLFIRNKISTGFCEKNLNELLENLKQAKYKKDIRMPLIFFLTHQLNNEKNVIRNADNVWEEIGYWRHWMNLVVKMGSKEINIFLLRKEKDRFRLRLADDPQAMNIRILSIRDQYIELEVRDRRWHAYVSHGKNGAGWVSFEGQIFEFCRPDRLPEDHIVVEDVGETKTFRGNIISPMPGKIVKIHVHKKSKIKKGDVLLVVESMKMENNLTAPIDGIVKHVHVTQGQLIDSTEVLMELIPLKEEEKV